MRRDLGVTEALRETTPEWLDYLYSAVTLLGDLWIIVPLLAGLYVVDVVTSLRRPTPQSGESLAADRTIFVIATVFGGLALITLLEAVIDAPRPPRAGSAGAAGDTGFPSGHAMAATVCYGALGWWSTVGQRRERLGLAALVVLAVGWTRLGLGVHYLVDVLGGVAFGVTYLVSVGLVCEHSPWRALALALGIATGAVGLSTAAPAAVLALVGVVGLAGGWQLVESTPVRQLLERTVRAPGANS